MGSSSRRWSVSTRGRRYTKHANDAVRYGGVPAITPKRPKESRQRSSRLITYDVIRRHVWDAHAIQMPTTFVWAMSLTHQLLAGPRHALANARAVTPAQLAGHRIWMPGLDARGEVAAYYDELATAFGVTIDMVGPVFSNEALLAEIADSSDLATLVGEGSRYLWPDSYDLRRISRRVF